MELMQFPRPCCYCGEPIVFAMIRTTARRPFDAKPLRGFLLSGSGRNFQARPAPVYFEHECDAKEPA